MSSAILYVAIVVIWACVLIPRWLRRDSARGAASAAPETNAGDATPDDESAETAVESAETAVGGAEAADGGAMGRGGSRSGGALPERDAVAQATRSANGTRYEQRRYGPRRRGPRRLSSAPPTRASAARRPPPRRRRTTRRRP